jgi:hypothetical protein
LPTTSNHGAATGFAHCLFAGPFQNLDLNQPLELYVKNAEALRETDSGRWTTPGRTGNVGVDPHFELSMICCAFLIADSSGVLSFFRMSIVFCAEAVASFLLPSFA